MLYGPQGSAKSSAARGLRQLIDPSSTGLRVAATSREDLFVAAANSHLVAYENLSGLRDTVQDAFCTMLTGGSFATRQLHTNLTELAIYVKRPLLLNGIELIRRLRANDAHRRLPMGRRECAGGDEGDS